MKAQIDSYLSRLATALNSRAFDEVPALGEVLRSVWRDGKTIYLCGNGGSAGNANHLANDLTYGAGVNHGVGLRVDSLSSNAAVITCLANDIGYENIYSEQLRVKANQGDVLIALSGSGNSQNIVNAINMGNSIGMVTYALLGFSGGVCKKIVAHPIHFEINDMQVAEDLQLIVGHVVMQYLSAYGPAELQT